MHVLDHLRAWMLISYTGLRLRWKGLAYSTTGNISVRSRWRKSGMYITRSGSRMGHLLPWDIVFVSLGGAWSGPRKPSTERLPHLAIMVARPDVNAIVHLHCDAASAASIVGKDIYFHSFPANVHYMTLMLGLGRDDLLRCTPDFDLPGSQELAHATVAALGKANACLWKNHGAFAVGPTMAGARDTAIQLERLCMQYALAAKCGTPSPIPTPKMVQMEAMVAAYHPKK